MGWWNLNLIKRAEDWVFSSLKDSQVPEEPKAGQVVVEDADYLSMKLRSMRLVNVRVLTTKFYGVGHSFTTLSHRSGKDASFHLVTTPSELRNIDATRLDRVVSSNKTLLGPIPYRGGPVGLELGLFSVKEADLAGPFIDVLESVASQAGVSVISAALPLIEPLKQGIAALTGTGDDTILEIGVSTSFDPPKTGWYVVMRAPKGQVDLSGLHVTPNDFRLVDDRDRPYGDFPYMVFSIAKGQGRSDWFKLPDLTRPYQELKEAVRKRDYNAAKDLQAAFRAAAQTSDDLLSDDADRIAQIVENETTAKMTGTRTSALGTPTELPDLKSLNLYAPGTPLI